MLDDHVDYYHVIASNLLTCPSFALELHRQWEYNSRIHAVIARRLKLTSKLQGFSGTLIPGCRVGRDETLINGIPLPSWACDILGLTPVEMEYEEFEDDTDVDLPRELDVDTDLVVQLMERISTNE